MAKTKEILDTHAKRRRDLIKTGGKLAVTAPAVAMLLASGSKPTRAMAYGDTPEEPPLSEAGSS